MEPQENFYCYDNKKQCKKKNCWCIIAIILLATFSFVIGLLIGTAISVAVLTSLAAVIVLAVILGLLLILSIILIICNRKKDKK